MALRQRLSWVVSFAFGIAVVSCKQAGGPTAISDAELLEAAIESQGGVERLKAGSSFSAAYQATLVGSQIKGRIKHKAGAMRLEYVTSFGEPVVMVTARDQCWQKLGRVVLPCRKPLHDHTTRLGSLLHASWLWPIKERQDLKAQPGPDGLTILKSGEALGTLQLDRTSYLVTGLKMQTMLGDSSGELVGTFSELEKHCGLQIPTKREYKLADKPFLTEKLDGVICEDVKDKVFEAPDQIKHGTVLIRHIFNRPLACTKLKGPLTGVVGAMNEVASYIQTKELPQVQGPAALIHRKGPPKARNPKQYVTDVCLSVHKKAWLMPKSDWKGKFFLHEVWADEVLAAYGIGDHVKLSEELPKLLLQGAKKRGRKPTGAMLQTLYMHPEHYPPEQRVSEMILYLQ